MKCKGNADVHLLIKFLLGTVGCNIIQQNNCTNTLVGNIQHQVVNYIIQCVQYV